MTDTKQINVIAARKTAYARNNHVTRAAGTSMSQKRKTLIVPPEAV